MKTETTSHEKTVQPAQSGCCCGSSKTADADENRQLAATQDLSGALSSKPVKAASSGCCGGK